MRYNNQWYRAVFALEGFDLIILVQLSPLSKGRSLAYAALDLYGWWDSVSAVNSLCHHHPGPNFLEGPLAIAYVVRRVSRWTLFLIETILIGSAEKSLNWAFIQTTRQSETTN